MDFLELCKKTIAFDSVSGANGTTEIVHFFEPLLRDLGFSTKTQDVDVMGNRNLNLLGSFAAETNDKPLLINTHLDTVDPGSRSLWTKCNGEPFTATISDGKLYGLGSADTKLAFVCVLEALRRLRLEKGSLRFRRPLHLLATAGEELGLLGTLKALDTQFVKAHYALDSEPTGLDLVWAHKGLCAARLIFPIAPKPEVTGILEKTFEGESAHSSTPAFGKNAIDMAFRDFAAHDDDIDVLSVEAGHAPNAIPEKSVMRFVRQAKGKGGTARHLTTIDVMRAALRVWTRLKQLEQVLEQKTNASFHPSYPTTATTLAGFDKSGAFYLYQDCRFIDASEADLFLAQLQEIAQKTSQEMPQLPSPIQVRKEKLNQSLFGQRDSDFVRDLLTCAQKANLSSKLATKTGCTEAAAFAAHGIETVVFGPGVALNNIHKPNEHVSLADLEGAVTFYIEVLRHFCLGS